MAATALLVQSTLVAGLVTLAGTRLLIGRCTMTRLHVASRGMILPSVMLVGLFMFLPESTLAQSGFDLKYERDYNIFNPMNRYAPDNPLNPINRFDPDNPFNPINRFDPNNPLNPINKYDPRNPFNPVNRYDPDNLLNPVNKYNPNTPFAPLDR